MASDSCEERGNADDTHKYYLLTVEFGIKAYRTYLKWCEKRKKY